MNVYDIKNKANEVLRQPNQLFKVILYVGIIQALFSALSGLFDGILGSIISLILSILTVTLGHGIIVASLKVVNNNGNLVDEKEDSLVGIKRFGQLFPTYFLYRVVVALAGIVVGVIGMLLAVPTMSIIYVSVGKLVNNKLKTKQEQPPVSFDENSSDCKRE